MNVLVGKFGKSILFNEEKWGMIGGDAQPKLFYLWLAETYPEHNFYMIGKNDIKQYKKKNIQPPIPDNLIDLWDDCIPKEMPRHQLSERVDAPITWPWMLEKVKKLNIDCGLFFGGPTGCVNIPETCYKLNGTGDIAKVLYMFVCYVAPMNHVLNSLKIPYTRILEDPKYAPDRARDLFHRDKFTLAQYNVTKIAKTIKSYEENDIIIEQECKFVYSGVENIFLLGEKKEDFRKYKKDIDMLVIMNEGRGRGPAVEEWVLSNYPDAIVSGKWSKEWQDKYPKNIIQTPMHDMLDLVKRTKYTYITPILKNWVTSKWSKMAHYGILPFFDPTYDTQGHVKIDPYLRVNSPEEMKEKIDFLNKNPKEYERLLDHIWELLDEKYYNGQYFKKLVDETFERLVK